MTRSIGWGLVATIVLTALAGCGTPRAVSDLPPLPAESLNASDDQPPAAPEEPGAGVGQQGTPKPPEAAASHSAVANEEPAPAPSGPPTPPQPPAGEQAAPTGPSGPAAPPAPDPGR